MFYVALVKWNTILDRGQGSNTNHLKIILETLSINWERQCTTTELLHLLRRTVCGIRELKQTDAAAANLKISIQKDSRPSESSRPLTSITLNFNGDLHVDRRRVSLLKLPIVKCYGVEIIIRFYTVDDVIRIEIKHIFGMITSYW